MASRSGGLFAQLRASGAGGLFAPAKSKAALTIVRGASRRAFQFEIYPAEAVSALTDFGAVYCYARSGARGAALAGGDPSTATLEIGYVGHTDNFAERVAHHEQNGHFTGHGFDIVLVMRLAHETIRADLARDLIEGHRPVLNDLLRGDQGSHS